MQKLFDLKNNKVLIEALNIFIVLKGSTSLYNRLYSNLYLYIKSITLSATSTLI